MKRILACAILFFFICGCSKPRTVVLDGFSGNFSFTVSVSADYGQRVYDYKLKYIQNTDCFEIEVLDPESIAGLEISGENGSLCLCYDGAELYTGEISGLSLSPLSYLPKIVSSWQGAVLQSIGETLSLSFEDGGVCCTCCFDESSLLPVSAEVFSGGQRVLLFTFGNIVFN